MTTKVVTYAAEVLQWKRLDGQPLFNLSDIMKYGPDLPHRESFDLMYGRCFASGWEEIEEIKHMNNSEINEKLCFKCRLSIPILFW